jgi:hypothetical protein
MEPLLTKIFSINYVTTILGLGVIFGSVGRVGLAWKAKDFTALANDGQLIMSTIAGILTGAGLIAAKDRNVTGVGTQAKSVDSEGALKNVEGEVVGKQSAVPPLPVKIPTEAK